MPLKPAIVSLRSTYLPARARRRPAGAQAGARRALGRCSGPTERRAGWAPSVQADTFWQVVRLHRPPTLAGRPEDSDETRAGRTGRARTRRAGEHLGHVEGLREEALDLARARHGQLVLLAQLVHAQDGDDVLQVLVVLRAPRPPRPAVSRRAARLPRARAPASRAAGAGTAGAGEGARRRRAGALAARERPRLRLPCGAAARAGVHTWARSAPRQHTPRAAATVAHAVRASPLTTLHTSYIEAASGAWQTRSAGRARGRACSTRCTPRATS